MSSIADWDMCPMTPSNNWSQRDWTGALNWTWKVNRHFAHLANGERDIEKQSQGSKRMVMPMLWVRRSILTSGDLHQWRLSITRSISSVSLTTTADSRLFTLFGRKVKPSITTDVTRPGWKHSIMLLFGTYTQIEGENIEVRNSMLILN